MRTISPPTDHTGCVYPPVGDEEREIRYLQRLKHLAARADAKGQAKEFTQALRQRRPAGVPLPRQVASHLKDESSAQRNLSALTKRVCTIFAERLHHRATMIREDDDDWYDSTIDILRCLYRNLRMFHYRESIRILAGIGTNLNLPLAVTALIDRYLPKFEKSGDNDFLSKALIKQHLAALLEEFIDSAHDTVGYAKKMRMVALQLDIEETKTLAKCVIAKPKQRPSIKLHKKSDDAEEPLSQVKQADPLANDDDWASDIDAETEDVDFIKDLVNVLVNEILSEADFDEDEYNANYDIHDFLSREFDRVLKLDTKLLLDPHEQILHTTNEIFDYLDVALYEYSDDLEALVYKTVEKLFTEVIKRRVEAMSPMALFGTNESFAYVLRRGLLKDFEKEKPYMRKARWGELPVRGSGTLEIVDDKGGTIKMEASYSPLNRKLVEDVRAKRARTFRILMSQAMPAVIPSSEIFNKGYNFHSNVGGFLRYRNAEGGSIWMFTSTKENTCISLRLLPQMTQLIEALDEIKSTRFDESAEEILPSEMKLLMEAMAGNSLRRPF